MDCTIVPAREVSAWILAQLFGDDGAPGDRAGPARSFPLAAYQEAAVRRAARILARRGGVLIADSVGLGKTFVALALIEDELRRGGGVVVVVPASLRSAWKAPLRRWSAEAGAGRVHLLSHAQLSRGGCPAGLAGRPGLVVVDEAHRFRNPGTCRYGALRELCAGAAVVLVTATPVNNGVADLHGLLALFAADDAFADVGVTSLRALFDPRGTYGSQPRPMGMSDMRIAAVRRVLREVMVRRTRSMLRDGDGDGDGVTALPVRFPRRAPPVVVRYDEPQLSAWVRMIEALELAPFTVGDPARPASGGQAALVRLGLLKRLDSSRSAFEASVRRQLGFGLAFLSALESGRLLRPRDHATEAGRSDVDPLQLVLLDLIADPCHPGVDRAALRDAVVRDLARYRRILAAMAGPDPKLDALADRVAGIGDDRVIVFTEFRDTARAIWRRLVPACRAARIDGGGAWLGRLPAGRATVIRRFAPRSNGAREPPPIERVDVLIATDVLAEGLNLQDARHVVCYDMPWNPIRVMQRVGRIDRLGSLHDVVVPHLFLPAAGLEDVLGLTRRLRDKLGSISTTVGGEDADELLARLGGDPMAAAAAFDTIETRHEDPLERLRLAWQAGTGAAQGGITRRICREPGVVLVAGLEPEAGHSVRAVVLARSMGRLRLAEVSRDGVVGEAGAGAAALLEQALSSGDSRQDPDPQSLAGEATEVGGLARSYFDRLSAAARAPRAARPGEPATLLARRLRAAMAATAGWLDPGLVARVDRVLRQLDRPLPPRLVTRARAIAAEARDADDPARVLDGIEGLLRNLGPADTAPGPVAGADTVILAVLVASRVRPRGRPRGPVDDGVHAG